MTSRRFFSFLISAAEVSVSTRVWIAPGFSSYSYCSSLWSATMHAKTSSSTLEVFSPVTGIEARLRVRSISLFEPSRFKTTTSSSFGRSGLFFAPENGPCQLHQARAQLGSRAGDAVSQLCRNLCYFHCPLSSTHGYATTSDLTCSVLAV